MNTKLNFENYIISRRNKVKISSKEIIEGDIFLALKGKNFHGNKFIKSSIKKGAKFCITDNKNFTENKRIIYVKNIFNYLNNLAIRKRSLYKGKVIGITGSAGKTTLKETLAFFLKKNHLISYSQKSYNNKLGVLISLLNMNLKSKYSIFEIGTNNFGEIKNLTKIVQPSEIFITNIQSTHLENFKTKNNIAKEKSDIFITKYNNQKRRVYLNVTNKEEKIIWNKAVKQKNLKIISINKKSNKYFIKEIIDRNKYHQVIFSINKKIISFEINYLIMFRLINMLFCYAFFYENMLNINSIKKSYRFLKPVDGRGLNHNIIINKMKVKIIDESYNANPDTMVQSVEYFNNLKLDNSKKILILGDMNELGKNAIMMHLKLLKHIDKFSFKNVILCGEFFRRSIQKLINPNNEFKYIDNKINIMKFLNKKVHKNDIIMIKCSNSTVINNFTKDILKKR